MASSVGAVSEAGWASTLPNATRPIPVFVRLSDPIVPNRIPRDDDPP